MGVRAVFLLHIPIYAVSYLAITLWSLLVVPVLIVNRVTRKVTAPIRNQYLDQRLENVRRATVLSGAV